jgi:hypothetical protein
MLHIVHVNFCGEKSKFAGEWKNKMAAKEAANPKTEAP